MDAKSRIKCMVEVLKKDLKAQAVEADLKLMLLVLVLERYADLSAAKRHSLV